MQTGPQPEVLHRQQSREPGLSCPFSRYCALQQTGRCPLCRVLGQRWLSGDAVGLNRDATKCSHVSCGFRGISSSYFQQGSGTRQGNGWDTPGSLGSSTGAW